MRLLLAVAAAACIAVPAGTAGAQGPAIVTLVEGEAALLRGATRFALAEGVRLQAGDIVEVADKGLAQVEFDGSLLSLGPRSRFHAATLVPRGGKAGTLSELYLLQGWSKFALDKSAAPFRLTTPHFRLLPAETVAIVHAEAAQAEVFVETGELRLTEGIAKTAPAAFVRLRAGEYYARKADQKGAAQSRPPPAFAGAMPHHYRDNLPVRAARYREREVAPRRLADLEYADVAPWLKGPAELRRPMAQRLRSKGIIFPEKHRPKPPPEQGAPK